MATLRIHFTPDDFTRSRLTPDADLQLETALSLDLLQSSETSKALASWRTWARRRLGSWATPLLASASPERLPNLLTVLRDDQNEWTSLRERYRAAVITPVWPAISSAIAMDRGRRTRSLLENGLEGLLNGLGPMLRWQAPVLQIDHPIERDLHLDGRGLVLVPSFFCFRRPLVLADPGRPAVLVHPIAAEARVLINAGRTRDRRPQGVGALMGSTRAAVLLALADGCTTTELAQRVGVSAATASQHASILRDAGLISTQRRGPSVLHMVTALGSAVLKPG